MTRKEKLVALLTEAQEKERRRVARLLHNDIGQNLTALGFNLDFIESQLPESVAILRERVQQAQRLVAETTDQIREVIVDLRPPMLDEYGLVEALDWYAQHLTTQTDLTIIFNVYDRTLRLKPVVESIVFRIVQEALANTIDHAEATQATILLDTSDETSPSTIRLVITDNGIGFDPEQIASAKNRLGLLFMKERAEAIQARCLVKSEPTTGTQVIIEIPHENQCSVG